MTFTEYSTYVSYIRYYLSCTAQSLVQAEQYGVSQRKSNRTQLLTRLGLYLQTLEEYKLPAKVVGTTAAGGYTITLVVNITPSDYSEYVNRMITGEGIATGTMVTAITADTITLSKALDLAKTNGVFTIGMNCITESQFNCIVADINQCFGASLCADPYFSTFNLEEYEPITPSDFALYYGSYHTLLTESTLVLNLTADDDFIGEDTEITFNFHLEYPYFAYPASYPDLFKILDQEGDDVLGSGAFDRYIMSLNIPGQDDTVQYKVYRTDYLTAIPNETYTFRF